MSTATDLQKLEADCLTQAKLKSQELYLKLQRDTEILREERMTYEERQAQADARFVAQKAEFDRREKILTENLEQERLTRRQMEATSAQLLADTKAALIQRAETAENQLRVLVDRIGRATQALAGK
jgi:hypothetical protein